MTATPSCQRMSGFLVCVFAALIATTGLFASEVMTITGTGQREYSGDGGPATRAGAGEPYGLTIGPDGVCVDSMGNVYIGDSENYRVRKLRTK